MKRSVILSYQLKFQNHTLGRVADSLCKLWHRIAQVDINRMLAKVWARGLVNRGNDLNRTGYMGSPRIRGTMLGAPILRITVFSGLYWGPVILGNYYMINLITSFKFRNTKPVKASGIQVYPM